jgi:hypothetical protein
MRDSVIVTTELGIAWLSFGGYWLKQPAGDNNKHSSPFNAEG